MKRNAVWAAMVVVLLGELAMAGGPDANKTGTGISRRPLFVRLSSLGSEPVPVLPGGRLLLRDDWLLQSSAIVADGGERISTVAYRPRAWYKASAPSTVLSVLVKNGVYPDPRIGLDSYKIPDSSDAFNAQHDLAKYSHLPNKRNPWRDPYWYRKEFSLPSLPGDRRIWLHLDSINYRAEAWLNGHRVEGNRPMVGIYERFVFDVTPYAKAGANVLAVKIAPVDHPGLPDTQLEPMGRCRDYHKEILRDATTTFSIGYDCMPTVPDRNMGLLQDVWVEWTGPVAIRHPFVVTELPLPETNRATVRISAELTNATDAAVEGILRGRIAGTDIALEQAVSVGPHETRQVAITPAAVMQNPRLWWPRGYGEQPLYDLTLTFAVGSTTSDAKPVRFGVRQIGSELHQHEGWYGRRFLVNGRKVFCRGGYVQQEILFDWDAARFETEIRYLTAANLNLIYFEDIPNPPDEFMDLCDRYGLMLGNCYFGCWSITPGAERVPDRDVLASGTVDILKRYRNHPSLLLHMFMNEGVPQEAYYTPWREAVRTLDGTRPWIPSGSFPDYRVNAELKVKHVPQSTLEETRKSGTPAWVRPDTPVGMNDYAPKSYGWLEPAEYFRWVEEAGNWMFMMESCAPSVPPMSSLARFIPGLTARGERSAPDAVWAHHDACGYYRPYEEALRRLHGDAASAADYAWKAHLLTADQHRAMFEAVHHRMWDITSGFTQWKVNACWPSVEWQVFDWYLKPMVSYFYIKRACEPLHVQLNLLDRTVSVINARPTPQPGLAIRARALDAHARLLWEKTARVDAPADGYRESFVVPEPSGVSPVYFVKLELTDSQGRPISDNFYWLRARGVDDLKALQSLPMTKVEASCRLESRDGERLARVKVTNPTAQIAFFIQLALVDGPGGEELLPVFWDDNYFSLLPGESREITARFAAGAAAGKSPQLEVGGWNVETPYQCRDLRVSPSEAKVNEPVSVTARIGRTFLDGSRVTLRVDGRPAGHKWAWARGARTDELVFKASLSSPGEHTLEVGDRTVKIKVGPRGSL